MGENEILSVLRGVVTDILPDVAVESVVREARLADLGANSVDRADIVAETLETLDLTVPLVEFATCSNIGEIVAVIGAQSGGRRP